VITELLGLAGSGVAGSVFGLLSDHLQARSDHKKLEIELEIKRRANEAGQTLNHIETVSSNGSWFSLGFLCLVATYCGCTALCFIWPDVIIHTFNPDDKPKVWSFLWGLLSFERQTTYVYTISAGGLGYSLLHPIAFQIGTVITGLNPRSR
jgi:hypothetical protein